MGRRKDTMTLDLFEVPQPAQPTPGGMDYRAAVSGQVSQMLCHAEGDRYDIAARASRLAGKDITKYMLDAYSAESREEFNLPLWVVPPLEAACESHALTNWLVSVRGGRMLLGRDSLAADLAKLERMRREVNKQIHEVRERMGESHQ